MHSAIWKESWNGWLSSWLVKRSIVRLVNSSFRKSWRICILTSVNTSLLLTLISCPMFTFSGRDVHRSYLRPRSTKNIWTVHCRRLREWVYRGLYESAIAAKSHHAAAEILQKKKQKMTKFVSLAATTESSHWLNNRLIQHSYASQHQPPTRAYSLLTRLAPQISWDELLKTRRSVIRYVWCDLWRGDCFLSCDQMIMHRRVMWFRSWLQMDLAPTLQIWLDTYRQRSYTEPQGRGNEDTEISSSCN